MLEGPQFDYLPEYLTVKQTFKLFANLRGLEIKAVESVLNDFIKVFKLKEFEGKLVQDLRSNIKTYFLFLNTKNCLEMNNIKEYCYLNF